MDLLGSDGSGVVFNQTGSYKSGHFTSRDGFTLRKKKTHCSQITTVSWCPGMTGFLVSVWSGVTKWVCGPRVEGPERWPLPWILSLHGLREHVLVDRALDQASHPTLWVPLCDFGWIMWPLPHCGWGAAITSVWLQEFLRNGRRQRRRKLFINCGQRQKDRQVVVMNEWGGVCREGECLLAPPTPQLCSQARASSLPSNRAPASGWECAQLPVKWPKCLPSDPLRATNQVGRWGQEAPRGLCINTLLGPWAHGLPLRQGQRAGCLPSVSSSVPFEFHRDRPQTVPVGLLWGTSALSFKIVWELQI